MKFTPSKIIAAIALCTQSVLVFSEELYDSIGEAAVGEHQPRVEGNIATFSLLAKTKLRNLRTHIYL